MLPTLIFTTTQAYKYLADHFIDMASIDLKKLFISDNEAI